MVDLVVVDLVVRCSTAPGVGGPPPLWKGVAVKVDEANLDGLKGMPDVDYDFDVSASLESAFRAAATVVEGQRGSRAGYRSGGLIDFQGYYSTLFGENGTTQLGDLDEIVSNLRLVASKVTTLDERARAENDRRRQAREWAQRQAGRNRVEKFVDRFTGGEEPPFEEISDDEKDSSASESVAAAAPVARQELTGSGPSGGVSSGSPSNLRGFASSSRAADGELSGTVGTLTGRCDDFAEACSWATLDASSVIGALGSWLEQNENDAKWAGVVAGAFEAAGAGDGVAAVPDAAIEASLAAAGVQAGREDLRVDPPTAYGSPPTTGYADDPVNAFTGNFVEVEDDLGFAGPAGGLSWRRSYSALNPGVGGFGPGWSSWCEAGLSVDGEGARLRLFDGRVIVFPRLGDGWGRAAGENLWLAAVPGGGWEVSSSWGLAWRVDAAGRVTGTSEGEGTGVELSYDRQGRLVRLTHEWGRALDVVWDDTVGGGTGDSDDAGAGVGGRVSAVVADDGRRVDYVYDGSGRLVEARGGGGARRYRWNGAGLVESVIDADGVVEVTNSYDERGRVSRQRSRFGRITRYAYLSGGVTVTSDEDGSRGNTWIHDRNGRLVGLVDADGRRQSTGYDRHGNPVWVRGRDGAETVSVYDGRGRLVTRRLPSGARVDQEWDGLDRLVRTRVSGIDADSDGAGRVAVTCYEYEAGQRRPCRVVDAEGGVTSMVWRGGLLRQVTDPTGVRVRFGYDEHGDLVASTDAAGNTARLVRDGAGRVSAAVTPLGHRTEFVYDPGGRLAARTDPDGARTRFEYTAAGRLTAVVDPEGGRTLIEHGDHGERERTTDPLGRVVGERCDDLGNLAAVELPDGSTWEFGYDGLSRLTGMRDGGGGEWAMGYGPDGMLAATTDPTGVERRVARGPFGAPVAVTDGGDDAAAVYDRLGRLMSVTGPDGGTRVNRYDLCGRLVETMDAAGATTRFGRDAAGRVVEVTGPIGRTYRYEWDECGRWAATVSTGGDRYEIVHDADSRIVGEVWPTGETVSTRFDACGRIVARRQPGRGVVRFGYDRCGRIVWVRDRWNGRRRFGYDEAGQLVWAADALGRVTRFEYNEAGRQVATVDTTGARSERVFDPMGRLVSRTDPLGRTTTYGYDKTGRLTSRTDAGGRRLEWCYDRTGRLERTLADGRLLTRVERDFAARTLTWTSADGERVETAWDTQGNLVRRLRDGVGVSYSYDIGGRRTGMHLPDGSSTGYEYDANNRLAAIVRPGLGRVRIDRDRLGRVVGVHGPGLDATWTWHDGAVVANRVNRRGFIQQTRVERDRDGRVTADVRDGLRTEYAYDRAGQLVGAVTSEGTRTSYEWDTGGRLVAETCDGQTTRHGYDRAGQLVWTRCPDGTRITYDYDPSGRRTRETGPDGERLFDWDPRGFLAQVTRVSRHGDQIRARRTRLHVDAGGLLAAAGDQPVHWDTAAAWPALAQIGARTVTDALAATALTTRTGGDDTVWLVPDTDGPAAQAPGLLAGPEALQSRLWEQAPTAAGPAAPAAPEPGAMTDAGPGAADVGVGADGTLQAAGLGWMGARVYDPATRGFLSVDPLEPVTGAAWAANPYSFAGNDPVGLVDPSGLRPVSEDDLRAYQQASNGMLQNAASAAGNWLSDNWEYIAAGAMVAAGVAVMCTGVGGPIGAAMMAGALTSAGGSIWSQKSANGTVDWGTVLRDGAVGAATGLIGGGASAAAARATAGMTSCLGKNILTGAVEGAIDGGAGNGLQYLTSGQPITPAGFAQAVGAGAGEGALGGGAGGALSHVTGIARYGCFTPDTPVLMADGTTKPISQVETGEQVLAHNPTTGQDEPATVEQTFVHEKVPTLRVTTTSGTVETTATHPFHVQDRGYTPAEQLREGDILHTPDGHTTTVVSIQATGRAETVHNLAITGHHNYHVATTTGQPILVHNNTNPGGCGPENTGTDDSDLLDQARAARDDLAHEKGRKTATVTGGYTDDGRVVAGASSNPTGCAEDDVARQLGGDPKDIHFTEAIRPRTGDEVPVCRRCQGRYDRNQFPPGAQYEQGGAWDAG